MVKHYCEMCGTEIKKPFNRIRATTYYPMVEHNLEFCNECYQNLILVRIPAMGEAIKQRVELNAEIKRRREKRNEGTDESGLDLQGRTLQAERS